jgi:hypothetical protein
MKHLLWSVCTLLCAAQSAPALAQTPPVERQARPPVADPGSPVTAIGYRSVFADTASGIETRQLDWRKANDEVGQFTRGHIDILKWEQEQADTHRPGSAPGAPGAPGASGVSGLSGAPARPARPGTTQQHRHQEPQ